MNATTCSTGRRRAARASGGGFDDLRLSVVFKYDTKGDYISAYLARPHRLARRRRRPSLVAVTGWASVFDNEGDERVLSTDAGATGTT